MDNSGDLKVLVKASLEFEGRADYRAITARERTNACNLGVASEWCVQRHWLDL